MTPAGGAGSRRRASRQAATAAIAAERDSATGDAGLSKPRRAARHGHRSHRPLTASISASSAASESDIALAGAGTLTRRPEVAAKWGRRKTCRGLVRRFRAARAQRRRSRSAVEPFLVMEVMRAAIDREAAGERVIHMEVGQPGAPAPRPVLDAARAALDRRPARLYRGARPPAAPRAHRPLLRRRARPRRADGADRRHDRLLGRLQPRLPRRLRSRRPHRARRARLSRPIATSCRRSASRWSRSRSTPIPATR